MAAPQHISSKQRAFVASFEAMATGKRTFGAVRKAPRGKGWRIDVRPHGWIYSVAGVKFNSKALANGVLSAIRIEIGRGVSAEVALEPWLPKNAQRAPVIGRYADWLEHKWSEVESLDRSPNTVREYARYSRAGGELEFWEGQSVYEVDYASLEDWIRWMAKRGLKAPTRVKVVQTFRTFLGWLKRRKVIDALPDFPELPSSDYEPTVVSLDVQGQIVEAIPEERRGLFLVLALLGARPGEARALNVADLKRDENGLSLHIRHAMQGHSANARRGPTKTRRWRSLPLPEVLEEWLDAHCDRSNLGAPLFPNPNTGQRWSHGAARDTWINATEAIGVEVGFYQGTKHSRATGWLADGVDERIIQKALGHSDIAMTHKYAKLGEGALVQLINPKKKVTH